MLMPYHSSLIADQKIRSLNQIISCRKRWVLQGILLCCPRRRKQGFRAPLATAQPMIESHSSANEKPLYMEPSHPRFGQRPFCL